MNRPLTVMWLGLRGFPDVQGGIETHAEHLCPLLVELGCKVTVIVRPGYQSPEVGPAWKGVNFNPIWAPRSKYFETVVHSLLGVLYAVAKRPDILHIQGIGPALMTPLARMLGLRVIVTHHGPDYDREKWGKLARLVLRVGECFGMRFSHKCISISEVIRQLVRDKHEIDSVLIPNGICLPEVPDTASALSSFGLVPKRYVLMVSRLVPEKRHHDLIEAFAQSALQEWKLVLVGISDMPDQYARSVLDAAKETHNVICTGLQTGAALKQLYAHAGMFVLPSSHEGLSFTLLEAMSYGLPVIASDIPANLCLGGHEITYFPLGDVQELAGHLKRHAAMGIESGRCERSRQYLAQRYNWRDIARKTHELYCTVGRI